MNITQKQLGHPLHVGALIMYVEDIQLPVTISGAKHIKYIKRGAQSGYMTENHSRRKQADFSSIS